MTAQRGDGTRPTRDRIAEALSAQVLTSLSLAVARCSCGWVHEAPGVYATVRADEHDKHRADVLLAPGGPLAEIGVR